MLAGRCKRENKCSALESGAEDEAAAAAAAAAASREVVRLPTAARLPACLPPPPLKRLLACNPTRRRKSKCESNFSGGSSWHFPLFRAPRLRQASRGAPAKPCQPPAARQPEERSLSRQHVEPLPPPPPATPLASGCFVAVAPARQSERLHCVSSLLIIISAGNPAPIAHDCDEHYDAGDARRCLCCAPNFAALLTNQLSFPQARSLARSLANNEPGPTVSLEFRSQHVGARPFLQSIIM